MIDKHFVLHTFLSTYSNTRETVKTPVEYA